MPVEPPEVDTLALVVADDVLEETVGEVGVVDVPTDVVARVVEILASQLSVHLGKIVGTLGLVHTVCRVKVKGCFEVLVVHLLEQTLAVGNEVRVP